LDLVGLAWTSLDWGGLAGLKWSKIARNFAVSLPSLVDCIRKKSLESFRNL
jgi:hypothetical protein